MEDVFFLPVICEQHVVMLFSVTHSPVVVDLRHYYSTKLEGQYCAIPSPKFITIGPGTVSPKDPVQTLLKFLFIVFMASTSGRTFW